MEGLAPCLTSYTAGNAVLKAFNSGNVRTTLAVYEKVRKLKLPLKPDIYALLLQLCVSEGEVEMAYCILSDMEELKQSPSGYSWCAMVALSVLDGEELDIAIHVLDKMESAEDHPRFRAYHPLLKALWLRRDLDGVMRLRERMHSRGVREPDFFLAEVATLCARAPGGLLCHSETAMDALRKACQSSLIPSPRAVEELQQRMPSASAQVGKDGVCAVCHGKLRSKGLAEEERVTARRAIVELARSKGERHLQGLYRFVLWMQAQARPFSCVIDGPNVAYAGQKRPGGSFSYQQVDSVMKELRERGEWPLVIMPTHYMKKRWPNHVFRKWALAHQTTVAASEEDVEIFNSWRRENVVFEVHDGSHDDWFWMLASVMGDDPTKLPPKVVTNDRMRDHMKLQLCPLAFERWQLAQFIRFETAVPRSVLEGGISEGLAGEEEDDNIEEEEEEEDCIEVQDAEEALVVDVDGAGSGDEEPAAAAIPNTLRLIFPRAFDRHMQQAEGSGYWHVPIGGEDEVDERLQEESCHREGVASAASSRKASSWMCIPPNGVDAMAVSTLSRWLKDDLQKELRRRGLRVSGTKAELLKRLSTAAGLKSD